MPIDKRQKRYETSEKGKRTRKAWRDANLEHRRAVVLAAVGRYRQRLKRAS